MACFISRWENTPVFQTSVIVTEIFYWYSVTQMAQLMHLVLQQGALKTRDWKSWDHIAGVENEGPYCRIENVGLDNPGPHCKAGKRGTGISMESVEALKFV